MCWSRVRGSAKLKTFSKYFLGLPWMKLYSNMTQSKHWGWCLNRLLIPPILKYLRQYSDGKPWSAFIKTPFYASNDWKNIVWRNLWHHDCDIWTITALRLRKMILTLRFYYNKVGSSERPTCKCDFWLYFWNFRRKKFFYE